MPHHMHEGHSTQLDMCVCVCVCVCMCVYVYVSITAKLERNSNEMLHNFDVNDF